MSLLLLLRSGTSSTATPTIAIREVDHRLALSVTHADGSITRWAGDEANAELVAGNLEFGSVVPGGFKDLTCELLRGLTPRADEGLFDDVRCYGAGNRSAWEGRMAQLPRTNISLRPGAVGWSAHLEDDQSFREIYVDRDLSQWTGPAVQRRINLLGSGYTADDPQVVPDETTGAPALQTAGRGPWSTTGKLRPEGWYSGAGIPIGKLYYAWKRNANVDYTSTNWSWAANLVDDDVATSFDASGELRAAGPGTGLLTATVATRTFAQVRLLYLTSSAANNDEFAIYWTCLALYGRHGLTLQGTGSAADPPGLLVTDMIGDVVRRAAPLLQLTADSITPNSFALTHFSLTDPTTASDAISRLNAYLLWEWAVWEDRTFRLRPPTDDVVWVARLSDGAQLDLEGDQAQDVYNGVVVTFTDPNGRRRTVGPPGATADVTDASLADTDPTNPVNAHGIPRRWAKLELSTVTTSQGAIQIGGIYLAEAKLAKRRGTLSVTGSLERQGQPGRWPAWMVRAGDYVTVGDRAGEPLRRVIEARYSHATRTTTMTLDSSAQKLDAILERLNAALVGVLS